MNSTKKNYNYNDSACIAEAFEMAYKNKSKKQKQINESASKSIKRFILIDKQEYENINQFKYQGVKIDYIYSNASDFDIKNNQIIITNKGVDKTITIDFEENESTVIYAKSGYTNANILYLLNKLIKLDFLVLNNPSNVQISSNKLLTAKLFDEKNIQQPKYAVISQEDCDIDYDEENFKKILRSVYENEDENNEYVCKILKGHGGHGVFLCKESNILSVMQCMYAVDNTLEKILIQEKLNIEEGDIRAYVLNIDGEQEIIDCVIRKKPNNDFRTNISLGATVATYKLKEDYEDLIKKVARVSGLGFVGIDFCIMKDTKEAYIIEINGAPGALSSLNADDEEIKEIHEKYYTKIINTLVDIKNG